MMDDAEELLKSELRALPRKPGPAASQSEKKRYSELMSAAAAKALAEALRQRGLTGTLPLMGSVGNREGQRDGEESDQ
ncbi:MAG: hypothetical protein IT162_15365 [Bryobacterales bacterium]|nr:hypothetical protein [Bryobacterales bacterium]